ncbi:unnamed protein product [Prorocentrum cordatum]|uniref:Poly(A) polymerase nucleotidyltransferase domain-containing protein n=1 Tax=Prorocentrum cordatum TaxID=2364126 RepID=A0ABN9XJU4_9DINO|nr:unnamed protein product [Polarella glacialis]
MPLLAPSDFVPYDELNTILFRHGAECFYEAWEESFVKQCSKHQRESLVEFQHIDREALRNLVKKHDKRLGFANGCKRQDSARGLSAKQWVRNLGPDLRGRCKVRRQTAARLRALVARRGRLLVFKRAGCQAGVLVGSRPGPSGATVYLATQRAKEYDPIYSATCDLLVGYASWVWEHRTSLSRLHHAWAAASARLVHEPSWAETRGPMASAMWTLRRNRAVLVLVHGYCRHQPAHPLVGLPWTRQAEFDVELAAVPSCWAPLASEGVRRCGWAIVQLSPEGLPRCCVDSTSLLVLDLTGLLAFTLGVSFSPSVEGPAPLQPAALGRIGWARAPPAVRLGITLPSNEQEPTEADIVQSEKMMEDARGGVPPGEPRGHGPPGGRAARAGAGGDLVDGAGRGGRGPGAGGSEARRSTKLVTVGSYRLGVVRPDGGIDTLCVGPPQVGREAFFTALAEKLKGLQSVTESVHRSRMLSLRSSS